MAKKIIGVQNYPRIENEKSKFYGYLDESRLNPHTLKINLDDLKQIIVCRIAYKLADLFCGKKIIKIKDVEDED